MLALYRHVWLVRAFHILGRLVELGPRLLTRLSPRLMPLLTLYIGYIYNTHPPMTPSDVRRNVLDAVAYICLRGAYASSAYAPLRLLRPALCALLERFCVAALLEDRARMPVVGPRTCHSHVLV
eukprot:jgi/Chrzof1/14321/UNPLg00594.t1